MAKKTTITIPVDPEPNPAAIQLTKTIDQSGLNAGKAAILKDEFLPIINSINEWEDKAMAIIVDNENQKQEMNLARTMRLELKDVRVRADKKRKELKEDSIREGKAIQEVYNYIEMRVKTLEEHLSEQENFAEIQRMKREATLHKERMDIMEPYFEFTPINANYGSMDQDDFDKLLAGARLAKKDKEEQERIRIEKEEKEKVITIRQQTIREYLAYIPEIGHEPLLDSVMNYNDEEFFEMVEDLKGVKKEWEQEQTRIKQENERLSREKEIQQRRISTLQAVLPYGEQVDASTLYLLTQPEFEALYVRKRQAYDLHVAEQNELMKKTEVTQVSQATANAAIDTSAINTTTNVPVSHVNNGYGFIMLSFADWLDKIQVPDQDPDYAPLAADIKILLGKTTKYIRDGVERIEKSKQQ